MDQAEDDDRGRRVQRQRSRASQDRILDAAVRALVEHGYAGASTLRIQQLAGVSRGRLLHQFPSRDDLLVAAVQHLAGARVEALPERATWPVDAGQRVDAVVDAMWSTYQQDYFWAATELWLAARHNPHLRAALLPHERRLYRLILSATDRMFGAELAARPAYPLVRDLLTTSMRGTALTYAFDRRPSGAEPLLTAWKDLARGSLLDHSAAP